MTKLQENYHVGLCLYCDDWFEDYLIPEDPLEIIELLSDIVSEIAEEKGVDGFEIGHRDEHGLPVIYRKSL